MKIKNGFTLLELLVVIGIIAILVALGTVSYSAAQKSSRDSRRKQDLIAIQNAMEQYYSQNKFVYPTCAGLTCAPINTSVYFSNSTAPVDPLNVAPYQYTYASVPASYTVTVTIEKDGSSISVGNLQ